MTVLSGTITNIFNFSTPTGPVRDGATPTKEVLSCYMTVTFSGTYVQGDNAQILAIPTAIQTAMKSGKTVTLLDIAFAAPGDEAGTPIGAKTVVPSGADATMELTGGDLSTEHAAAALGTIGAPLCFFVSFSQTPS